MALIYASNVATTFPTLAVSTTAAHYNSTYLSQAFFVPDNSEFPLSFDGVASNADTWIHYDAYFIGLGGQQDGYISTVYADNGDAICRIEISNGDFALQVFQAAGGASPTTASYVEYSTGAEIVTIDIRIDQTSGTQSEVSLYVDEVLNATLNSSSFLPGPPDTIGLGGNDYGGHYISMFAVADADTRGLLYRSLVPTGAGNYTAWEGDDAEIGDEDVTTFASTDTASERLSSVITPGSDPTGTISSLFVMSHARRGSSGPNRLANFLRKSSTDDDGTAQVMDGPTNVKDEWATNPFNGDAAWTYADLTGLEIGIVSSNV